jgi:Protein of unknown function (DUF742)
VRDYDRWLDHEAGPVVRPYALTGGRTAPAGDIVLDLITVISASGPPAPPGRTPGLAPEHRRLLGLCQQPVTVADVAADVDLPLGVVRILLADLIQENLVVVQPRPAVRPQASHNLLQEVLDGLRAL